MADVKKLSELEEANEVTSTNFIYVIQEDGLGGYAQKKAALGTVSTLIVGDVNAVLDAINGEVV